VKIILLAAGKSTRFKSSKHKALHDLLGKTVLERVLTTMHALQSKQIQLVLGHQLPLIAANLTHGETYIEQKEQFIFVVGALVSRIISLHKAAEIMEMDTEMFLKILELMGIDFSYLTTEDIDREKKW